MFAGGTDKLVVRRHGTCDWVLGGGGEGNGGGTHLEWQKFAVAIL